MQLQLFQTETYSAANINLIEKSVQQRTQQYVIDSGRGQFLDDSSKPLSYTEKHILVLFSFIQHNTEALAKISSILNMNVSDLQSRLKETKKPLRILEPSLSEEQATKINQLKIDGVFALKEKLSLTTPLAAQFIGITSENKEVFEKRYPNSNLNDIQPIGVTGLQGTFDELLLSSGDEKLMYHVDALGRPLFGMDVKYTSPTNSFYPLLVKTTIDSALQRDFEEYLNSSALIEGGLLLLDIEKSEIKAVVSQAPLNTADPFKTKGINNLMFTQLTPGSVFKAVVAAAAIEKGIVNEHELFNCNVNIYGEQETEKMQYGLLTFKDSFAKSCNATFGELSERLARISPSILTTYAEKLGVIGGSGWKGDIFHYQDFAQLDEERGQVFLDPPTNGSESVFKQTGIGQLNVQVTPLAVANMMATIARGGESHMVKGVSEIQYQSSAPMFTFPYKRINETPLSPYTAMKLQELLRWVVESEKGTAHSLSSLPYAIAGKTGTAQVEVKDETPYYHKWFAGYFPFENPKYALVAVNANTTLSGQSAHQMFADAVRIIAQNEESLENE